MRRVFEQVLLALCFAAPASGCLGEVHAHDVRRALARSESRFEARLREPADAERRRAAKAERDAGLLRVAEDFERRGLRPDAQLPMAELLHRAGAGARAHALLERVLERAPSPEAYQLGVSIRLHQEDARGALAYLRLAEQAGSTADFYLLTGVAEALSRAGDPAAAAEVRERAIRCVPEESAGFFLADGIVSLAEELDAAGDRAGALDALRRGREALRSRSLDARGLERLEVRWRAEGESAPWSEPAAWIGEPVNLQGRVVLVEFLASWCDPCHAALAQVEQLHRRHGAAGLVVVGVANLEDEDATSRAQALERLERMHSVLGLSFSFAVFADNSIAEGYGVDAIPHAVLIDTRGRVDAYHVGASRSEEFEAAVAALLEQAPGDSK